VSHTLRPPSVTEIKLALRQRARHALDKARAASAPAERERWGLEAAAALSELQRPEFQ
jgi:hypothetical protein